MLVVSEGKGVDINIEAITDTRNLVLSVVMGMLSMVVPSG